MNIILNIQTPKETANMIKSRLRKAQRMINSVNSNNENIAIYTLLNMKNNDFNSHNKVLLQIQTPLETLIMIKKRLTRFLNLYNQNMHDKERLVTLALLEMGNTEEI